MSVASPSAAIIGTGLIGRGWAVVFARAGWQVRLWDRDRGARSDAAGFVADAIDDLAEFGMIGNAGASVTVADTLEEAVAGVSYVQESLPEDRDIKNAIFRDLDAAAAAETLIGSSTSTMPGTSFLSDIPGRKRCIVAHPANPPHLMPVVEIVPAPWNDEAMVGQVRDLLSSVGQVPVIVRKEIVGFVMNRLQTALVNESVALVAADVIAPEDLDAVVKHSLGLRWAFMGPFETMDMNAPAGFLDYATRYGRHYQQMGQELLVTNPWPHETLEKIEKSRRSAVETDAIQSRMRWRDKALMQLLALKKKLDNAKQDSQ
jgi:3-hydroxyacyl-CoA dehydrogenase